MIIFRLAWLSLLNRRLTALLTILSIALSVMLFLGVEKVRHGARSGFINTISGTDLIVGARAGDVQLLLYAVFRIGNATNNISVKSLDDINRRAEVEWMVPISLGDSHRGFRVMGTSSDYFTHYKYRRNIPLAFEDGVPFDDLFDAVVGSDVAAELGYSINGSINVAHGTGNVSFGASHDDKPFRISGILKRTGTPVDRTVHISLEAIEAIHVGWQSGTAPRAEDSISADAVRDMDLTPKVVTAAYVGLKSKIGIFSLQRYINNYRQEPITAILPGVAFAQLWAIIGNAEKALMIISIMVIFTAFLGMIISILGTLNERRREMAILRAIGARPVQIFGLFVAESAALAICGVVTGIALLYGLLAVTWASIEKATGLYLQFSAPGQQEYIYLLIIIIGGIVAGSIPALRAYKMSVSDGLTVRT
ncbi:MAG: ABC transporter permease [Rhizobiaceae bacterium]|nr:ABC transporter permease [Rhizobiaceae bacterium]